MKELKDFEVELVSGGDRMTWEWGTYIGGAIRDFADAFSDFARSDATRDVIV